MLTPARAPAPPPGGCTLHSRWTPARSGLSTLRVYSAALSAVCPTSFGYASRAAALAAAMTFSLGGVSRHHGVKLTRGDPPLRFDQRLNRSTRPLEIASGQWTVPSE